MQITLENYDFLHDPSQVQCGRSALLVRKGITIITERKDLELASTHESDINYLVENIWVECKLPNIKKNVVIGILYRHPKGNINLITEQFEKSIGILNKENKLCFLCGDLNVNALCNYHATTDNFLAYF